MSEESPRLDNPLQSKNAFILAVVVVLGVFALSFFLCRSEYLDRKKEILAVQEEGLAAWLRGAAEALRQWDNDMVTQSKRVSASELYRLFASEAGQFSPEAAAALNDTERTPADENMAMLAEQVPLMRNVLLDFMNFNGLADARLVNEQGLTILSSLSMPTPLNDVQRAVAARAIKDGKTQYAPLRATTGGLLLDLVDPLTSMLTPEGKPQAVAALLLTSPVTNSIARFLSRTVPRNTDARPYLLQNNEGVWENVQVQAIVPVPSSFAVPQSDPLPFGLRTGVTGKEVYSMGVKLPGFGWWLVIEEPTAVVDGILRTEAISLGVVWSLVSAGFVLLLSLFWWVAVGRTQRAVADRFQHLYTVIQRQKRLLDSINVSLEVGLVMADAKGNVQLCNRAFSQIVGRPESEAANETLASLFNSDAAIRLMDGIRSVANTKNTLSFEVEVLRGTEDFLYRVTLFPFVDEQQKTDKNQTEKPISGAVGIFQDITQFRRLSEKRRRQQLGTISALVKAIEGVDPYLAGHSAMMVELASQVCGELHMGKDDCETVRIAASLSQIGKLFLPRELLTKNSPPTPEEQVLLMRAPEHAHVVLKDVDFSLPVPQAVYEMYERPDGSGYPRKLAGDSIGLHARILAVLNAYCAMASPRSYRNSMPVAKILENLRAAPGAFDQNVVDAVATVVTSSHYRGPGAVQQADYIG